uniref:Uncharacterized protein n=1 Tax=Arion vulgaris TaxID=1028688 RepID=A0A0B6Y148_9EUPU
MKSLVHYARQYYVTDITAGIYQDLLPPPYDGPGNRLKSGKAVRDCGCHSHDVVIVYTLLRTITGKQTVSVW